MTYPGRMTVFQDRLRAAVARDGRSQREISSAARLGAGYINEMLANPQRSPTLASATALARVLRVDPAWLMGVARPPENGASGFSESQARPFELPAASGQRPDLALSRQKLVGALAPNAQHPALFVLSTTLMAFGLLASDVLIVDLKARAMDGDLVLATVADFHTGEATTLVRRLASPFLVTADPTDPSPSIVIDGTRTVVMGPVVASIRAPVLGQPG